MESWNDRLRLAMSQKNVSAADLTRATGISAAGIKKWVDGVTAEPKYKDIANACNALGVSPLWLMDGRADHAPVDATQSVSIDLIDLVGSCGYGTINFEQVPQIKKLLVSKEWFNHHFPYFKPGNVKVITALGDSMTPDINDGDAVFIDVSDKSYIRDGVYAVLIDSELYIKRVQKTPRKLTFISTNPAYSPFEIRDGDPETVRFIGRVIKGMCIKDI